MSGIALLSRTLPTQQSGGGISNILKSGLEAYKNTGTGKPPPQSASGPKAGSQTKQGSYKNAPDASSKGRYNATKDNGIRGKQGVQEEVLDADVV